MTHSSRRRLLAPIAALATATACSSSHSASAPATAPPSVTATAYACHPYPTGAPPAGEDVFYTITNDSEAPHVYSLRVFATRDIFADVDTPSLPAHNQYKGYKAIPLPASGGVSEAIQCAVDVLAVH